MKVFQALHAAATLFLFLVLLVIGILMLAGVLEFRRTAKEDHPGRERRAFDADKVKARLVVIRGVKPNEEYSVYEGKNVIGRADQKPVEVDLSFQEPADRPWSTRQHAVVTWENGGLFIEDLKSTNGTFVNRARIQPGEKKTLKANDVIQIGEVHLKVLMQQ